MVFQLMSSLLCMKAISDVFFQFFVNVDTNNDDDEIEKTLAILIGLIAGVALIIVFVSFLSKVCEKGKGGK
ncbi:Plasmodesmata-located protein 6 [Theobroma cacao]|uniref:Plasmodesmata-located protein 6 n=1 Tax=Theobroma cacao TaxID=3641 RepID=A0A061EFK0_THECC|nr:Plasmodesmata-located protein 6 [Theobroma cacao]